VAQDVLYHMTTVGVKGLTWPQKLSVVSFI